MRRKLLSTAIIGLLAASASAHADQVGVTAAVSPDAQSRFGSAPPRQVRLGDHVLHDQRFQTDAKGVVQILLADGSSFTVGPNSSLVIDSFVYDPAKGTAKLAASASRGVMRFIGGAASKGTDGVRIKTPVGVAGIRGAIADLDIPESPDGQLRLDLLYGFMAWISCGGGSIGSVSSPGSSMLVDGDGKGCGAARYANGLPPMNPGQVPGAPPADNTGDGDFAGSPNGLAGFSGGPTNFFLSYLFDTAGNPGAFPNMPPLPSAELLQALFEQWLAQRPVRTLDGTRNGFISSHFGGMASDGSAQLTFDSAAGTFAATLSPSAWSGRQYAIGTDEGHYTSDTDFGGSNGSGSLQLATDRGLLCDCDFLQWGTWQAAAPSFNQMTAAAVTNAATTTDGGYWITGALTPTTQLPTNVTANYGGLAIGTTFNAGVATQGVTGNFWATVDFATGSGGLIIAGFDGRDFGDSHLSLGNTPSGMAPNGAFGGSLQGNTDSQRGSYTAAFASDGSDVIAALLGNFTLQDGQWSAAGIFAGTRGNATQPIPYPAPPPEIIPVGTLDGSYNGFSSSYFSGMASDGSAQLTFDPLAATFSANLSPSAWSGESYSINTSEGHYSSDTDFGGSNSYGNLQLATNRGLLCDCDFLQWGNWTATGAPVNWGTASADGGYWITGTLTATAQLPTDISANYGGLAIGTTSYAGTLTPGVTGNFWATVDFATGSGGLIIAGFDGRDFGDSHLSLGNTPSGMAPNGAFGGSLQGNTDSQRGSYTAAFASDGSDVIAALLGNFTLQDGEWSAAGIFAGTRGNATQPIPYPEVPVALDGEYAGYAFAAVGGVGSWLYAVQASFDASTGSFTAAFPAEWNELSIGTGEGQYQPSVGSASIAGANAAISMQGLSTSLLCDCDYLAWGSWQGLEYDFSGYWVTGNLTAIADLPTDIVATYEGFAKGTLVPYDGGDSLDASGSFSSTVNFATGLGSLQITDFGVDGVARYSFGASDVDINRAGVMGDPAKSFSGQLSSPGYELSYGWYEAAFAANGTDNTAAVLGAFDLMDATTYWQAHGVFAGNRVGTEPAPPSPPFDGAYSGFGGYRNPSGSNGMGAGLDMNFSSGAQQFTAEFTPYQWEGATYGLQTGEGTYIPGSTPSITGSNSYGSMLESTDPQALCDCNYLAWGSWEATDVPGNGTTYSAEHGYWVVGQLTTLAELPTDIVATYAGLARGSLFEGGSYSGEATGDFSTTVDFSTGLGSMQIANYGVAGTGEGRTFGTSNLDINHSNLVGAEGTAFSGSMQGMSGQEMYGEYTAAFAAQETDKTAAMLGTFRIEDGAGWEAQGVFAGSKTGATPTSGSMP